jgi:hypothetical protein
MRATAFCVPHFHCYNYWTHLILRHLNGSASFLAARRLSENGRAAIRKQGRKKIAERRQWPGASDLDQVR